MLLFVQIGRVANINSRGKSTKLQVQWFYRPEEAAGGRKVRKHRHTALHYVAFCCATLHSPSRQAGGLRPLGANVSLMRWLQMPAGDIQRLLWSAVLSCSAYMLASSA